MVILVKLDHNQPVVLSPFNNSVGKKSMPEFRISNEVAGMPSSAMLQMLKSFANLNKNTINDLNISISSINCKKSICY